MKDTLQTIAFYNTENLFDVYDDTYTKDNDFLPTADKKWTTKRYKNKLRKLGFAISSIGKIETGKHPAIIGLAEVENALVLEDLIQSKHLNICNYSFVHYDSPDERGIDVALLYDTTAFDVEYAEPFSVDLTDDFGEPDYTRDILLVTGLLNDEKVHIIVNHWSSRREGTQETEHKRMAASLKVSKIIDTIKFKDQDAKIIVLGDFNDDPLSKSIKHLIANSDLHNPMESLIAYNRGTLNYKFQWNLFDQILLSRNFSDRNVNGFQFVEANIFDNDFLKIFKGKYRGNPFRTFVGQKYKGGYSDHFPVFMVIKKAC